MPLDHLIITIGITIQINATNFLTLVIQFTPKLNNLLAVAELLKNMYSEKFIGELSKLLSANVKNFDTKKFTKAVINEGWKSLELKARMKHIARCLHTVLPGNYSQQTKLIVTITQKLQKLETINAFPYMFFCEFIEIYGLDHFKDSQNAIEKVTQFISCEFAVRPFLIKYPAKMIPVMQNWVNHKNPWVRRLSSEGLRPRLPWGMKVPYLITDPAPTLYVLEKLKNDSAITVQKSVANNLNDISKDHPEIVLDILKRWKGKSETTDWILKHGCRGLLKKGNVKALGHFGFKSSPNLEVKKFSLSSNEFKIGDKLFFQFDISNKGNAVTNARMEYIIYYNKARNKTSKKVFHIKETLLSKKSTTTIKSSQALHDMTTRKHYPGKHIICVVINGMECAKKEFNLKK